MHRAAKLLFIMTVLLCAGAARAQMNFGMAGPKVDYEAAVETDTIHAGSAFKGALQISVGEGWHINSNKPLDEYLIATELTLEAQPGFSLLAVAYPEHKVAKFGFSPDPMAVYEGKVVLGFAARADETIAPGDYMLKGTFRYQACNDKMCAPPKDMNIEIPAKVSAAGTALNSTAPAWFASAAWDQLPEQELEVVAAASPPPEPEPEEPEVPVAPAPILQEPEAVAAPEPEAAQPDAVAAPESEPLLPDAAAAPQPEPAQITASVTPEQAPVEPEAAAVPAPETAAAPMPEPEQPEAAIVDEGQPWRALADQFEVTGTLAGFSQKQGFLDFLETSASGGSPATAAGGQGWWWMILVVLGGGLLLNLTPCVLPLIPINIAIIGAGAQAGSRSRGFALGGAYGLGIALVYGALGLVVVLGLSTAFGALNSTAWFNAVIAALFVLLALAMFDIIQIDFSRFQSRLGFKSGGGGHFLVALGMGAVSALLAGACVAPVVIYTILQAQDLYSQGNVFALALPFGLGAGMALPWPFLGAGLSFLPKPGKWMVRVKQAFGVFILGFAAYYGYLAVPKNAIVETDGVWTASLEEGMAQALEEGRPVIIDFWATWCKNCLAMDKTVLKDAEVLERLENHVKIKYQAEELTEAPAKDVVEYFKVMGLPTFIVLEPKG
ncbi:MAG: thioredoxin fold domain-containing protein [Candidatus Hydrogenedentes bacterium]|nr:thioredoxin fold domain-containing protein [Candidatus Hydrogenedentota bacterium]